MIFPIPRKWFGRRSPKLAINPGRGIDQELEDRSHRLGIGILIDDDYTKCDATLIVSEGRGKFLRLKHSISESNEIDPNVSKSIDQMLRCEQPSLNDVLAVQTDLSHVLFGQIESLKQNAGKYVDRIMYVAVSDSGLRTRDFDGNESYTALLAPALLANLSGLTIVDSFATSDMIVGGNGRNLDCLPIWMLLADRAQKIASVFRVALKIGAETTGIYIPPSDGLDADLPNIQQFETFGERFVLGLADRFGLTPGSTQIERLNDAGRINRDLNQRWSERTAAVPVIRAHNSRDQLREQQLELIEIAFNSSEKNSISPEDLIRTAIVFVANHITQQISEMCPIRRVREFVIHSDSVIRSPLQTQLEHDLPIASSLDCKVVDSNTKNIANGNVGSAATAILGMLHIDQMPANIPWITGAASQKIIGRLTPGCPASWRHLVRNMADFQPPAMRLRDAI